MADYALTASVVSRFIGCKCPENGEAAVECWGEFADAVGPALPFLVRKDALRRIPFRELGLPCVELGSMIPQQGEMWVLFCFRDALRDRACADAGIRTDGFALVLEWRKGASDSALLSRAFHALADLVRRQQKVEGWGLHPAYARYGDNVDFTDADLFADDAGRASVASAFGALAAGLYCAVRNKRLSRWPFPTLQWDEKRGRIVGVAGLREKMSVAIDCGARVITVAKEQLEKAEKTLRELKESVSESSAERAALRLASVRGSADAGILGKQIAHASDRLGRALKWGMAALLALACGVTAVVWDCRREVDEYFCGVGDRFGVCFGVGPIAESVARKMPVCYRQTYCGYVRDGNGWVRQLQSTSCIGPDGELRNEPNSRCAMRKYVYDKAGRIVQVDYFNKSMRRVGTHKYLAGERNKAEMIDYDDEGDCIGIENEKMVIEYDAEGKTRLSRQYFITGDYKEVYPLPETLETREEFFDVDGNRMLNSEGAAIVKKLFAPDRREIAKSYFDQEGRPVLCYRGYHCESNALDAATQSCLIYYLGVDGAICTNTEGFSVGRLWYGAEGEVVQSATMNASGGLVEARSSAIAGFRIEKNQSGETVKTFFGADGKIKANEVGYARVRYAIDGATGCKMTRFYDASDNPHTNELGVCGWNSRYDSKGNEIERDNVGFLGQPVENSSGWAFSTSGYDDRGRIKTQVNLDQNRQLIPYSGFGFGVSSARCERILFRYDRKGRIVSRSYAKKGTGSFWGAECMEIVQDAGGRLYGITFLDERERPILSELGFASIEITYDSLGGFREVKFLDKGRKLVPNSIPLWGMPKAARIERQVEYRPKGVTVRWRMYNEMNLPCEFGKLKDAVILEIHYDRMGGFVDAVSYDINSQKRKVDDIPRLFRRMNGFVPFNLR